jgi:hypothetical protein
MAAQLVVVTNKKDPHADVVIGLIADGGRLEPVRVNSDDFLVNAEYSFEWSASGAQTESMLALSDSGRVARDVRVIWWRKPLRLAASTDLADPEARRYSESEGLSLLRSVGGLFPEARWVNDPGLMASSARRLDQIAVAQSVGLPIPETLVTNDWRRLAAFVDGVGRVIVKPLDFDSYELEGERLGCFAREITRQEVDRLSQSVAYAPVLAQRRIEKCVELRVTIIGDLVFACAIDGSSHSGAVDDWRRVAPTKLRHRIVGLNPATEHSLRQMMARFGLRYGAFDLIQEPDGTDYFLELNPNGQYLWIEQMTGAPLSQAVASLIEGLAAHEP